MGDPAVLERLRNGDIEVLGRMPYSSNATFLVEVCHRDGTARAVYKPSRGERPLWDFPTGLYRRELACYLLSEALGWRLVPETVIRDGPLGEGSLQAFIEADFEQHYFTLLERARYHDQLRRLAVFDLVANSTDRKGGHLLVDADDHIWAIDNGLSFHAQFKLRTVVWDFAGDPIPQPWLDDLGRLLDPGVPEPLADLLEPLERDALQTRAAAVIAEGVLPHDPTGRRWPWPVV